MATQSFVTFVTFVTFMTFVTKTFDKRNEC